MINQAADLYESFSGHDAEFYDERELTIPKVGVKIGTCDGVMYTTVRDGKTEHYIHKFKASARPTLGVGHNGKALVLIGGNYTFTERGIVDK